MVPTWVIPLFFTLVLSLSQVTEDIEKAVIGSDVELLEGARAKILDQLGEETPSEGERRKSLRYTLAYVNWRLSFLYPTQNVAAKLRKQNKKTRDRLLKEAEAKLKDLVEAHPEDAEALALLGTLYGARIGGMWSGMRLGPRADEVLERAHELEPDNPRVAFQMGVGAFFKPRMFGGGDDKAEAELLRAIELFAKAPENEPWPNWGHADAWIWLGQVQAKRKEWDKARAAYEQALVIAPGHRWVEKVLLPELEHH